MARSYRSLRLRPIPIAAGRAPPEGAQSRESRASAPGHRRSARPGRKPGPALRRGSRRGIYRCTPMRRRCGMFTAGRERSWLGSARGGRRSRCAGFGAGTCPRCGGRGSGVLAEPSARSETGRGARRCIESSIRSVITTSGRAPRLNETFEEPALIHPPFIVRPRIADRPNPRWMLALWAAPWSLDRRSLDAPPPLVGTGRSASPHAPCRDASASRRQERWRVGPSRHEPSGSVRRARGQRARDNHQEITDLLVIDLQLQRLGLVRSSATLRPHEHTTRARAGIRGSPSWTLMRGNARTPCHPGQQAFNLDGRATERWFQPEMRMVDAGYASRGTLALGRELAQHFLWRRAVLTLPSRRPRASLALARGPAPRTSRYGYR